MAANLAKPKSQTCHERKLPIVPQVLRAITQAHFDSVILRDEQVLSLQIPVQAVACVKVRHGACNIDGKAEAQSPAEVEPLIDNMRAKIAIREILGDDKDAPSSSGRLGLDSAGVVE